MMILICRILVFGREFNPNGDFERIKGLEQEIHPRYRSKVLQKIYCMVYILYKNKAWVPWDAKKRTI
jgi:hypothetical protein